ncbi:MFS transporter [Streptomyces achromogenes]
MQAEAALGPTRLAPLRVGAFRRFMLANLISATGSAMAPLALAYAVIGQGGGAGALGVVLATNTVPTVAFLLLGGVLADRLPRSKILFAGNLLAATAQGGLAIAVANHVATTALIAGCGLVSGAAVAFTAPASQGVVTQLVSAEHLQQANALVRLPSNIVRVLGPVVGGLIVASSGAAWALAWDSFTFVIAALLLVGLHLNTRLTVGSPLADLRTGWSNFWARRWLWTYTAAGTVLVAAWLAGYQLLGPIVAKERYSGASSWGLVQGFFALGLLAGTLVCLGWKPARLLAVSIATGSMLFMPLAAMGCSLPLPWVLLGAFLAGIGLDVAVVTWTTAFQQHVPAEELGRMSSFNSVGERLAIPLGYLITALAAHLFSDGIVLLVCAGVIVATTLVNLCIRDVYRVNRVV